MSEHWKCPQCLQPNDPGEQTCEFCSARRSNATLKLSDEDKKQTKDFFASLEYLHYIKNANTVLLGHYPLTNNTTPRFAHTVAESQISSEIKRDVVETLRNFSTINFQNEFTGGHENMIQNRLKEYRPIQASDLKWTKSLQITQNIVIETYNPYLSEWNIFAHPTLYKHLEKAHYIKEAYDRCPLMKMTTNTFNLKTPEKDTQWLKQDTFEPFDNHLHTSDLMTSNGVISFHIGSNVSRVAVENNNIPFSAAEIILINPYKHPIECHVVLCVFIQGVYENTIFAHTDSHNVYALRDACHETIQGTSKGSKNQGAAKDCTALCSKMLDFMTGNYFFLDGPAYFQYTSPSNQLSPYAQYCLFGSAGRGFKNTSAITPFLPREDMAMVHTTGLESVSSILREASLNDTKTLGDAGSWRKIALKYLLDEDTKSLFPSPYKERAEQNIQGSIFFQLVPKEIIGSQMVKKGYIGGTMKEAVILEVPVSYLQLGFYTLSPKLRYGKLVIFEKGRKGRGNERRAIFDIDSTAEKKAVLEEDLAETFERGKMLGNEVIIHRKKLHLHHLWVHLKEELAGDFIKVFENTECQGICTQQGQACVCEPISRKWGISQQIEDSTFVSFHLARVWGKNKT